MIQKLNSSPLFLFLLCLAVYSGLEFYGKEVPIWLSGLLTGLALLLPPMYQHNKEIEK